jgi:saccharopine dehydrogenase (NADP+, L-glutamate forming)
MEGVEKMTHRAFINSFLDFDRHLSVEEKLCSRFNLKLNGSEMQRLAWSDLFSSEEIGLKEGTPAQILENILNKKWKLVGGDKDLIVMWHRFQYQTNGMKKILTAHLTVAGKNEMETAMAQTVGLPIGIAVRLLLEGKIKQRGVIIPTEKELYDPVLAELKTLGIRVVEDET